MAPLRVLIAEDHVLMRAGLRLLLEQSGTVVVVAEASDGAEALRLLALHRTQLMERLGIHEMAGLVRLAIRAGLVDRDR